MLRPTVQASLSLVLIGSMAFTYAAAPSIGIAMASGPFEINRSAVQGNASLFEGSEIRTTAASSKLRLNGGARLEVGTESQVKVFGSYTILEKGAGQVENNTNYRLEAKTLRVSGAAPRAIARVQLDGSSAVLVSAVNGPVRISNAAGVLLAKLAAGGSLRFEPQGAAADTFELSGCLLKKGGKTIIVDRTSNQIFELRGADTSTEFGNRVNLKGKAVDTAASVSGAGQVVRVESLTTAAPGGCLATAAAIGADPLPGTTTSTPTDPQPRVGGAGGTNKAVIAGVVIAGGAGAGLAVALASKSKSK